MSIFFILQIFFIVQKYCDDVMVCLEKTEQQGVGDRTLDYSYNNSDGAWYHLPMACNWWQPPDEGYVKCNWYCLIWWSTMLWCWNVHLERSKLFSKSFNEVVWVLSYSTRSRGIGIKGSYILAWRIRTINGAN